MKILNYILIILVFLTQIIFCKENYDYYFGDTRWQGIKKLKQELLHCYTDCELYFGNSQECRYKCTLKYESNWPSWSWINKQYLKKHKNDYFEASGSSISESSSSTSEDNSINSSSSSLLSSSMEKPTETLTQTPTTEVSGDHPRFRS